MSTKKLMPTVETLTVDVQVIRIGNKQMTKAVFNQLYNECLHDENYSIIYPLWGKVFYNSEEWVIFQKGNDIRKYKIYPNPYFEGFGFYKENRSDYWEKWKNIGMPKIEFNNGDKPKFSEVVETINKNFASVDLKNPTVRNLLVFIESYKSMIEKLNALPQLFIAV